MWPKTINFDAYLGLLLKSDLVVAIEANPQLCNLINQRFKSEIDQEKLVVENCVVQNESSLSEVPFYIHKTHHVLSQFPKPRDLENFVMVDEHFCEDGVAIIPWLVGDEHKKLNKLDCKYMFGHFELPYFKMNAMVEMPDHGGILHNIYQILNMCLVVTFTKDNTKATYIT